ncbi:uncharacterized protein ARB_06703 [Trichophyton benhamiae CBS 112371]|uniref:Adenylyl cyclase-associated protein n=2 Tax=Trichophyton TaxID=5550 RepID=D4ARG1_ARTBC|nr:uncharacterized protein ARB_06703 [Trichophyton benhamiae CBS 112371]EFE34304.1 hypothetical protein ARB_06703 [Trichophyton benhamiae CBS 112371]
MQHTAGKMVPNNHMNNLTTLIKRLEAATSRLEDMAASLDSPGPSPAAGASILSSNVSPGAAPPLPAAEPLPKCIEAFDAIISNEVKAFLDISQQLGDLVVPQSKAVLKAFEAERKYLLVSTKAKKPEAQPPELFTDLHRASDEINNIRESNRPSPFFNHLSAVAEGVVALGWFFETRPATFVTDTLGGAQFYGNRVLNQYKDKDKTHVEYIQAYYQIYKSLIDYIKEYYPRGVTWNDKDGIDVMDALKQVSSGSSSVAAPPAAAAKEAGGAPPPPPPPPPPGPPPVIKAAAPSNDMSAVFDQLNQGSAVTAGLRKVDKSEQTHKNPSLRAQSIVPGSPTSRGKSPAPSKKPKPESMRVKKPSRKQLEGNKWFIEHFDSPADIVEISASLTQSILISRCNKTIIKVNGKANAISLDNCVGVSIIVDSLVSSLEAIKCSKFALQIDGNVPAVMFDQIDGGQVYLNAGSMDAEILTSKCTAINIVLPPQEDVEDSDAKECPIPEQIRTTIKDGAIFSEIVDHVG